MKPKISLITATHRRPDLLYRCIKFAQKSTLKEYEHLIIGDNCPWARRVCDLFKDDPRIKYFETPSPHVFNAGSIGKNIGIKKSLTNFITYCDDDNVILPNHLEVIYNELSNGIPICRTLMHNIFLSSDEMGTGSIKNILKRKVNEDELGKSTIHGNDMQAIGHIKEVVQSVGYWNPPQVIEKDSTWTKSSWNEDDYLLRKIKHKYGNKFDKKLNDVTIVYYFHVGCNPNTQDSEYENRLSENQLFVYPELLGEF
jgi:glycosyltransferase involved in cell wall biosynthesis